MPPYASASITSSIRRPRPSAAVALATKLFQAAGAAGIYAELPFGRILADITAARQHVSNQFETIGRNAGAAMFGAEDNQDFSL